MSYIPSPVASLLATQILGATKPATLFRDVIPAGSTASTAYVTIAATWVVGETWTVVMSVLDDDNVVVKTYTEVHTATSTTVGTIASEGQAQFALNPGMAGQASISVSGAVVTFTGKDGAHFTITSTETSTSGTAVATASVAWAAAATAPVGRAVVLHSTGYTDQGVARVKTPVAADFTAETLTATVAPDTASIYSGHVKINGVVSTFGPVAYSTSATVTNAAIATAINAVMDARTDAAYNAVASSSATTVVMTVDVAGASLEEFVLNEVAGVAGAAVTLMTRAGTTLAQRLRGFMPARGSQRASIGSGTSIFPGGLPAPSAYAGPFCAIPAGTTPPAYDARLWVSVDASGSPGALAGAGAATHVYLGGARHTAQGFYNLNGLEL